MIQMGTYWITEKTTGKIYFGSSQDLDKRLDRHWRELRQNVHHNAGLQELWNKNFQDYFVTIITSQTREQAYELEESLITFFSKTDKCLNIGIGVRGGDNISRNPNKDQIINRIKTTLNDRYSRMSEEDKKSIFGRSGASNSMFGKKHSIEARELISKANIGNTIWLGRKHKASSIAKMSENGKLLIGSKNPFYGRHHTNETKQKIAAMNKGRIPSNAVKIVIDGVIYNSATEASRLTKISLPTILFRIRSKNPKFRSYCFLI